MNQRAMNTRGTPLDWRSILAGCVLALAVCAQANFTLSRAHVWREQTSPGAPPNANLALIAGAGERAAIGYALNLYAQSFDAQAGTLLKMRDIDHYAIRQWLEQALIIEPRSSYALMLAGRVYGEMANQTEGRALLDLVHRHFSAQPNQRWVWLAHAVYVARHKLQDDQLARRYARSLREQTDPAQVPRWARQLELFLLADLNELQAARVLLAAMIDSGQLGDEHELALISARLAQLEGRFQADQRPKDNATGLRYE